jgi:pre-mRNA-splicing factor CWC22
VVLSRLNIWIGTDE